MKSKFLRLCLSVVIAIGIWLYVITVVSPESQSTYRDIPVTVQGASLLTERQLVITNISNKEITLRLAGNRSYLVQLNNKNIPVILDVSKIYEPGVYNVRYTAGPFGNLPDGAIEIQHRSPENIQITVESLVTKELEVRVKYQGTLPEGYFADEANLQMPEKTVSISGPASVVDKISEAFVIINLDNHTDIISDRYPVVLYDVYGDITDPKRLSEAPEDLNVTLPIKKLVTLPVRFDVFYTGGATTQNTTLIGDITTLTVSGHKNVFTNLKEIYLGKIDLSTILEDTVLELPISLPSGVSNETDADVVKISVAFKGLVTKKLTATVFRPTGVPQGMTAVIETEQITVTLRGPQAELDAITQEHLTVLVDFSATGVGTSNMVASVIVSSDFPTVGAVGTYEVRANLMRDE